METCQCLEAVAPNAMRAVSVMKALSSVVRPAYLYPLVAAYSRVFITKRELTSILGLNVTPFATVKREAW